MLAAILGLLSPLAAQAQQAAAPAGPNPFEAQADALGASRCAGFFAGLGEMATAGSSYNVQVEANQAAPDEHALQGVAGMSYNHPEIQGPAASVVLAAPAAQGCQGNLVRVVPMKKPCSEVVAMLPPGAEGAADLAGVALHNVPQTRDRILLISSTPASCVVVSVHQVEAAG